MKSNPFSTLGVTSRDEMMAELKICSVADAE
jgi:hypothetical protein